MHTNTPEHATQQHQYPVVHTHQMTGTLRAQAADDGGLGVVGCQQDAFVSERVSVCMFVSV